MCLVTTAGILAAAPKAWNLAKMAYDEKYGEKKVTKDMLDRQEIKILNELKEHEQRVQATFETSIEHFMTPLMEEVRQELPDTNPNFILYGECRSCSRSGHKAMMQVDKETWNFGCEVARCQLCKLSFEPEYVDFMVSTRVTREFKRDHEVQPTSVEVAGGKFVSLEAPPGERTTALTLQVNVPDPAVVADPRVMMQFNVANMAVPSLMMDPRRYLAGR